jgi:predicted ferric reductase
MKKEGYFVLSGILGLIVLVIVLFSLNNPTTDWFRFFIRLCSLLGLVALFVSSILTPFQKELYKIFKRPFIKIHHVSAITGLVLITMHPVLFAIDVMIKESIGQGFAVFLPKFETALIFWELAGRPALILIYLGLIGVLLRRKIKNYWRWLHTLNYLALIFGVVHGILIGSDFYNFKEQIVMSELLMTILFLLLILVTTVTFTIKRITIIKRKQLRKKRKKLKEEKINNQEEQKEEQLIEEN